MADFIKAIEDSSWADRTKRNRIAFINVLKNNIDPTSNNFNFLKKFNVVAKYILDTTTNPATRKTKILEVKSILKLLDDAAAAKYENLVHSLVNDTDEYRGNNLAKPDNKTISYMELISVPRMIATSIEYIYDKLFLSIDEIDKLKSINAKHKYLRMLTNYIIMVLYCFQPPVRADWALVQFKPSKTANWYDVNKGIIHWNNFKNVKSFGPRSFLLKNQIRELLTEYVSVLNYIIDSPIRLLYLVGPKDYKEFTRETFSVNFIRVMNKYLKKKISINDVRHCYENHIIKDPGYNDLTINQKKDIHDRLLHSFTTAQEYLTV
jgi:hypothetical protein